MRRTSLVVLCLAIVGCADAAPQEQDYEEVSGELSDVLGRGDILPDPCDLIAPLVRFGDDAMHAGLALGVEGNGVVLGVSGLAGWDIVWDLYHQQMSVSQYRGFGFSTGLLEGSVSAYGAAIFGFENGVADWDGHYVSAGTGVGIPLLDEFAALEPAVFASAEDADGNGLITPAEVIAPPDGVYGFNVGLGVGIGVPDPFPFDASLIQGKTVPRRDAVAALYRRFKAKKLFGVVSMQVRLVDAEDGSACSERWPAEQPERDCVIEFGDPSTRFTRRALHTAVSICDAPGEFTAGLSGCENPLSWQMSVLAVAIAALRDSGLDASAFCGE